MAFPVACSVSGTEKRSLNIWRMNERSLDQSVWAVSKIHLRWFKWRAFNQGTTYWGVGEVMGINLETGNDGKPLPRLRLKKQGEEIVYPKSGDVWAMLRSCIHGRTESQPETKHQSREEERRNIPTPLPSYSFPSHKYLLFVGPAVHQASQRAWLMQSLEVSS